MIVSAGRGVALEGLGRRVEADAAFDDVFSQTHELPASTRARLAWAYGFAISTRDPEKALKAFDDALRQDPRNAQAFYGRAMIAMGRGNDAERSGTSTGRSRPTPAAWNPVATAPS